MKFKFAIIIIIFCSCQKEKKTLKDYTSPYLTINLNNTISKDACLNCLCIVGNFTEDKSEYISFIDYHPGIIYSYNVNSKKIAYKFKIPKECYIADVLKVYNTDSILYFNNHKGVLTVCDTQKIKCEYYPTNFYPDSNITFTSNTNQMKLINEKLIFDISLKYNESTKQTYYDKLNRIPKIGFFEFKNGKLLFNSTNLFNQVTQSREARIADNSIIYTVNAKKNKIIFTHKCSNNIYTYDLSTKTVKDYTPTNTQKIITPIYYSKINLKANSPDPYLEAVNKQNVCSNLIYNSNTDLLYRIVHIYKDEIQKTYLQVLDNEFDVKGEFELPETFIELIEFKGEVLLHSTNKKNNEIVYEKINFIN